MIIACLVAARVVAARVVAARVVVARVVAARVVAARVVVARVVAARVVAACVVVARVVAARVVAARVVAACVVVACVVVARWSQPTRNQRCGRTGPVVLVDCKMPPATTIASWKLHGTPGATQRVVKGCGVGGERASRAWGSAFTGVEGGGLGFHRLRLYW